MCFSREKKLTRKRKRNKEDWQTTTRKRLRQSGKEYIDKKNNKHNSRVFVYKQCIKCPYKCSEKICEDVAKAVHLEFWNLTDDEKFNFYNKTTQRLLTKRVRKENKDSLNPRTYSFVFKFSLNDQDIRVCRDIYLRTLCISARRVAYFHSRKKTGITNTPHRDQRGRLTQKKILEDRRRLVKEHNFFPSVPGHYCRKNTHKRNTSNLA